MEGLKILGQRLALEVVAFFIQVAKNTSTTTTTMDASPQFSLNFVCHSLGGLIARSCMYHLLVEATTDANTLQLRANVKPCMYVTLGSPHLGTRSATSGFRNKIFKLASSTYCNYFLGLTGKELQLADDEKNPILLQMAQGDYKKALEMFHVRTLVTAVRHDGIVPWPSCAIADYNYFDDFKYVKPEWNIVGLEGFVHEEDTFKWLSSDAKLKQKNADKKQHHGTSKSVYAEDNLHHLEFRSDMMQHLNTMHWKRIHVAFHVPEINKYHAHVMYLNKPSPFLLDNKPLIADVEQVAKVLHISFAPLILVTQIFVSKMVRYIHLELAKAHS